MIHSLRTGHRRVFMALALLLPLLFAAALVARRPPTPQPLDPRLRSAEAPFLRTVWQRDGLWEGMRLRTRLLLGGDGGAYVELEAQEPLRSPKLLLYWAPARPAGTQPGPGSRLLGALSAIWPQRFELPPGSADNGVLILYSLGRGRVQASTPLSRNRRAVEFPSLPSR